MNGICDPVCDSWLSWSSCVVQLSHLSLRDCHVMPLLTWSGMMPWYTVPISLGFAASVFIDDALRHVGEALTNVIGSKCLCMHDVLCTIGERGSPHVVGMYLDTALSLRGNSVEWTRCDWSSGMRRTCRVGRTIFWCIAIGDRQCLGLGALMPLSLGSNTTEGLEAGNVLV